MLSSKSFTGKDLIDKLEEINITINTFNDKLLPAFKKISAHAEDVRKARENSATSAADDYEMEEIDGLSSQVQIQGTRAVSNGSLTVLQGLITILTFIFDSERSNAKDYELVFMRSMQRVNRRRRKNQRQDNPEPLWIHKIGFWCLNPAIIFRDMCEKTHSVILTSGTLSPVSLIVVKKKKKNYYKCLIFQFIVEHICI
jgi:Rad3-related DNA helicase